MPLAIDMGTNKSCYNGFADIAMAKTWLNRLSITHELVIIWMTSKSSLLVLD